MDNICIIIPPHPVVTDSNMYYFETVVGILEFLTTDLL